MCGFVGIWQKGNHRPLNLARITAPMAHRGPDEERHVSFGHFHLGFRRLGIIDLAGGQQPMFNEDGNLCLVVNGEIYNYRALRKELEDRGHRFATESDSEVILHLYEDYGEEAVTRLRGMFAFVIYDRDRDLLYGARDRFGIKPLYYLETPSMMAIGSEAKALAALPEYRGGINEDALPHYLTFQYVPEPFTMFDGIYKVPPGHSFTYTSRGFSFRQYWEVEFSPRNRSLPELVEETRDVLRESVVLHTQADVPWGAFLSGGIDSTIIVALLRELGRVSTFSVGYADQAYSELSHAAETARYLDTDHQEYLIEPGEFWDHLPRLVWHMDDPVADPAAISLYFVARMARKKVTVVLSGEGADEVFGGYDIYREAISLRPMNRLPAPLRTAAGVLSRLIPQGIPGKSYLYRGATPLSERYTGNAFIFSDSEKRNLLRRRVQAPFTEVTRPLYERARDYDDYTTMQYIDILTWMAGDILVKADRMTMANSLELRVPYLDHHVFEMAATIPTHHKVRGHLTKYVLRQAFADLVPPGAATRPKRGFPVPTRVWLRGDLARPVSEVLSDPSLDRFFSRTAVSSLLNDHLKDRADNSRKLWTLLIFALWQREFARPGVALSLP